VVEEASGEVDEKRLISGRWVQLNASGDAPPPCCGHATAVDSEHRMWLHGGFGTGSFGAELRVLEAEDGPEGGVRWRRVQPRGAKPSPRHKHTMVVSHDGRLLLFGGNDWSVTRGFYELDVEAAALASTAPALQGTALATAGTRALALVLLLVSVLFGDPRALRLGMGLLILTESHLLAAFLGSERLSSARGSLALRGGGGGVALAVAEHGPQLAVPRRAPTQTPLPRRRRLRRPARPAK